ncbi:27849_t:CDS:2, partial [Gigaspora margarita]
YGIKSIKLEGDSLVIEYQSGTTETKSTKGTGKTKSQMRCDKCKAGGNKFDIYEVPVEDDIALFKKIKTYLESLPSKSVSLEELEQQETLEIQKENQKLKEEINDLKKNQTKSEQKSAGKTSQLGWDKYHDSLVNEKKIWVYLNGPIQTVKPIRNTGTQVDETDTREPIVKPTKIDVRLNRVEFETKKAKDLFEILITEQEVQTDLKGIDFDELEETATEIRVYNNQPNKYFEEVEKVKPLLEKILLSKTWLVMKDLNTLKIETHSDAFGCLDYLINLKTADASTQTDIHGTMFDELEEESVRFIPQQEVLKTELLKKEDAKSLRTKLKELEPYFNRLQLPNTYQLLTGIYGIAIENKEKTTQFLISQEVASLDELGKKIKDLQEKVKDKEPNETEKELLAGLVPITGWASLYDRTEEEVKAILHYITTGTSDEEINKKKLQSQITTLNQQKSQLQTQLDLATKTKEELATELQREKG